MPLDLGDDAAGFVPGRGLIAEAGMIPANIIGRLADGALVEELERQLEANEKKARKDRLSLLRIHEDLASLGYEGGYDAVRLLRIGVFRHDAGRG